MSEKKVDAQRLHQKIGLSDLVQYLTYYYFKL